MRLISGLFCALLIAFGLNPSFAMAENSLEDDAKNIKIVEEEMRQQVGQLDKMDEPYRISLGTKINVGSLGVLASLAYTYTAATPSLDLLLPILVSGSYVVFSFKELVSPEWYRRMRRFEVMERIKQLEELAATLKVPMKERTRKMLERAKVRHEDFGQYMERPYLKQTACGKHLMALAYPFKTIKRGMITTGGAAILLAPWTYRKENQREQKKAKTKPRIPWSPAPPKP